MPRKAQVTASQGKIYQTFGTKTKKRDKSMIELYQLVMLNAAQPIIHTPATGPIRIAYVGEPVKDRGAR
jgi:hypothetical protein